MRVWALLIILTASSGCNDTKPVPPSGEAAGAGESATATATATAKATATATGTECKEGPPQTGGGCDMEGIQAVVKAEISADGGVGRCYRTHAPDRATGRILARILLSPEGLASSVDITEDSFDKPDLANCLSDLLVTLHYPPPGDVPCTALYPFNFQ